jgi:L-lactate dehydrogenase
VGGSDVVLICAGLNEKAGGATDRDDPRGRLKLLEPNAAVYRDAVPRVVAAAPAAVLVAVTDPPDPLADLIRALAGHERVLGTGTVIDTLRFRVHIAAHLGIHPSAVEGLVVGEHGTSEVMLWSSVRVAGAPLTDALGLGDPPRSLGCERTSSATSASRTSRSSRATTPAGSGSASSARGSPKRSCATSASSCRWRRTASATA